MGHSIFLSFSVNLHSCSRKWLPSQAHLSPSPSSSRGRRPHLPSLQRQPQREVSYLPTTQSANSLYFWVPFLSHWRQNFSTCYRPDPTCGSLDTKSFSLLQVQDSHAFLFCTKLSPRGLPGKPVRVPLLHIPLPPFLMFLPSRQISLEGLLLTQCSCLQILASHPPATSRPRLSHPVPCPPLKQL